MKFIGGLFLLFVGNLALDAESYIAFIEERSRDEHFVEEYTKWSTKLLSQPGYLLGSSQGNFPCSIKEVDKGAAVPTSVHALRPSDIKCVAAMGDSLTTGLGARGATPMDLLLEERGEITIRATRHSVLYFRYLVVRGRRLLVLTNPYYTEYLTEI